MKLEPKDYLEGDYEKYIQSLTKENMKQLFVENFGGWSNKVSDSKFFKVLENGFVKLFFLENKFIGYVSFNAEKDFDKSYLINDIHIIKEHQGKGYGSEILNYVTNKAKENQIKQLHVFVFKNNQALNFYLKNEFKEVEYLEKSNSYILKREINV